jgi:hypothetical protein
MARECAHRGRQALTDVRRELLEHLDIAAPYSKEG